jgi:tetratricopeptide (TPR) repeat protein
MTRENILFSIIGLFFGYCVAFTLVTYINVNQGVGATRPGAQQAAGGPSAEEKELQSLVEESETAARQKPQDFEAQKNAAIANMQLGDYEGAIEYWMRARELRPDDYESIVQLGNNNFEARRYETAERWYREALTKKPDDVNVRTDLGLTYFLREPGDYDRAIAEYRASLKINPRHEPTLQNLTIAFVRKGSYAEAEASLKNLSDVNPTNPALSTLRNELEKARRGASPQGGGSQPPGAKG